MVTPLSRIAGQLGMTRRPGAPLVLALSSRRAGRRRSPQSPWTGGAERLRAGAEVPETSRSATSSIPLTGRFGDEVAPASWHLQRARQPRCNWDTAVAALEADPGGRAGRRCAHRGKQRYLDRHAWSRRIRTGVDEADDRCPAYGESRRIGAAFVESS